MKVLVILSDGFEEIEAVTIIDILRRAGIEVTSAASEGNPVTGSHNIQIRADMALAHAEPSLFGMVVIPGGMPGSANIKNDTNCLKTIRAIWEKGGYAAAICAGPIALSAAGIMDGKKFTCSPGFESQMPSTAVYNPEPVVEDGRVITGKGPACAMAFALKLVEIIKGGDTADNLKEGMQVYWDL